MQFLASVYQMLVSTRLAMLLLTALTLAAFSGVTIYKNIFSSVELLILVVVFVLNLGACTVKQSAKVIRLRKTKHRGYQKYVTLSRHSAITLEQIVQGFFNQRGYKVEIKPTQTGRVIRARKYPVGYYGSAVFHWGLLLVAIGGLCTIALGMSGTFALSEGNFFRDNHQAYLGLKEGQWRGEQHGKFTLRLEAIDFQYDQKGKLSRYPSTVVFYENGQPRVKTTITAQKPFYYNGSYFYQYLYGFTPALILKGGRSGVSRFYVDLNTGNDTFSGEFSIPGTKLRVKAEFIPNVQVNLKKPNQVLFRPQNPGLRLQVWEAGKQLFSGLVEVGKEVSFDNYTLGFDHYKSWAAYTVVANPGLPLVYLGFFTGVTGLLLLYLFVPKEVRVEIDCKQENLYVTINYFTTRFSGIFQEEVTGLIHRVTEGLEPQG